MSITLDRIEINNYGYYTDDNGDIFPFSVEIIEIDGKQESLEISWDDNRPENVNEIEDQLRKLFEEEEE